MGTGRPGLTSARSVRPQVIILIGNKADLEAQRDVTYEEAKQFAEENGEPRDRSTAQVEKCIQNPKQQ